MDLNQIQTVYNLGSSPRGFYTILMHKKPMIKVIDMHPPSISWLFGVLFHMVVAS